MAVGIDQKLPEGFEIPFKRTADYFEMNYKGCAYFSTGNKYFDTDMSNIRQTFIDMLKKVHTAKICE